MKEEHIKIYTASPILVRRLKSILQEHNIHSLVKSDKIPAYEISNYIDELYVLNSDKNKAISIVEDFKREIS